MINTTFYARRLHSLVGLLALGGFLMEHILTNASALGGAEALNGKLAMMELIPKPIFLGLEIGAVAIPFLFHAIYGIYICMQAKNNPTKYGYLNNWNFAFQRWTAWFLLVFLVWHVGYLRCYVKGVLGKPINYELIQSYVTGSPIVFVLYLIGMLAAIFHFTNGITTFLMTWGVVKGPRAQKTAGLLSMMLCAALSLVTIAFMVSYFVPMH